MFQLFSSHNVYCLNCTKTGPKHCDRDSKRLAANAPFVRLETLRHGLSVDIVNKADASKPEDKRRILGSIAFPRAATVALLQLENAERFTEVNDGLKSHFALASWYGHLVEGRDVGEAAQALRADALRRMAPGRSCFDSGCH